MARKNYKHEMAYSDGWKKETGELPVTMTSDYLFRALLQADEKTLKAMVASLLHMNINDITDIVITNPIVVGDAIDEKEFHLDVRVIINDNMEVNLEMQVIRKPGFIDRTLLYMCRAFDQLSHGEDFVDAGSVVHIWFTDFTVFPKAPEFYSTYKFINEKNINQVYSDKIRISLVDLTSVALATDEDRAYGIDLWAQMFKCRTWEEIKMVAEKNHEVMDQAISSVWLLTEDEQIREQIRRRTAAEHEYQRMIDRISELEEKNSSLEERNTNLGKIASLMSYLAENGRNDDIIRAGKDEKFLDQLLTEYKEKYQTT